MRADGSTVNPQVNKLQMCLVILESLSLHSVLGYEYPKCRLGPQLRKLGRAERRDFSVVSADKTASYLKSSGGSKES